jgi:hypothetical protein
MAAVLEISPDPEQPSPPGDVRPAPQDESIAQAIASAASGGTSVTATATGLKPIERLTSDSRIDRIIPESDTRTLVEYRSRFARDFIRSDYNFCAAKVTVARGGKVKALDIAFRQANEWLSKSIAWVEKHNAREFQIPHELIELKITHPLAGRLVRCLSQYDRLFIRTTEALLAAKIQSEDRENILANAEKRFKHIVQVCMPDNDQYDFDGTRRDH